MNFYNLICWLVALIFIATMLLGCLARISRGLPELGIFHGKLRSCPNRPNCICSEFEIHESQVEPLAFAGDVEKAWNNASAAAQDIGGKIRKKTDSYLWVTFTSKVFRFVDDLELRMDSAHRMIHVRSASRVGYSDFGVNRKRFQKLRVRFDEKQNRASADIFR